MTSQRNPLQLTWDKEEEETKEVSIYHEQYPYGKIGIFNNPINNLIIMLWTFEQTAKSLSSHLDFLNLFYFKTITCTNNHDRLTFTYFFIYFNALPTLSWQCLLLSHVRRDLVKLSTVVKTSQQRVAVCCGYCALTLLYILALAGFPTVPAANRMNSKKKKKLYFFQFCFVSFHFRF